MDENNDREYERNNNSGINVEAEEPPVNISEPDENGVRYYSIGNKQYGGQAAPRKHSLRNSLIIFSAIIVGVIILGVSCNMAAKNVVSSFTPNVTTAVEASLPSYPYIATLYVEGTIMEGNTDYWGTAIGYQHKWTLEKIDELINDGNNKGIVLFVNSPGGGVYESDELYLKIKEYKEVTGNPVYSAMGSMAASGGYYISAPCDKIIANRNCWTGSIGVTIGTLYDFSGLLERYGVQTTTITSGANKAMGSSVDPLTPEQQAIFQSLVDESYEQFVGIVADGRGMNVSQVKKLADGRIYTAKQALDAGLIDGIGTFDEAVMDMQVEYDLNYCDVVDVKYTGRNVFGSLFGKLANIGQGQGDLAVIKQLMDESNEFPVSYMCEALQN